MITLLCCVCYDKNLKKLYLTDYYKTITHKINKHKILDESFKTFFPCTN